MIFNLLVANGWGCDLVMSESTMTRGRGAWDLSPVKKLPACRPVPVTHSTQIGYTPC